MFARPVDSAFPVNRDFAEKDKRFTWSIDPDNGFWIPIQDQGGMGNHRGTDFDCPPGTIVRAIADGYIIRSRFDDSLDTKTFLPLPGNAGLFILQSVDLPGYDNWFLKYSHLKASHVPVGQRVSRSDAIAESGQSGDTQAPMLHVELMNQNFQCKPIQFVY